MATKDIIYVTPSMKVYEVLIEGILCMSGDDSEIDMNPEIGNM